MVGPGPGKFNWTVKWSAEYSFIRRLSVCQFVLYGFVNNRSILLLLSTTVLKDLTEPVEQRYFHLLYELRSKQFRSFLIGMVYDLS